MSFNSNYDIGVNMRHRNSRGNKSGKSGKSGKPSKPSKPSKLSKLSKLSKRGRTSDMKDMKDQRKKQNQLAKIKWKCEKVRAILALRTPSPEMIISFSEPVVTSTELSCSRLSGKILSATHRTGSRLRCGVMFKTLTNKKPVERTATTLILEMYGENTYTTSLIQDFRSIDGIWSADSDLTQDLTSAMVDGMRQISTPYDSRESNRGVYYGSDFCKRTGFELNHGITGRAPWNEWQAGMSCQPFFAAKDGMSATDAMATWMAGPTIADCGSALSWAMNYALLKLMGAEKFDRLFSSPHHPMGRLIITHTLYDPLTVMQKADLFGGKSLRMGGNPFWSLMDVVYTCGGETSTFDIEDLEIGDILHIGGAPNYKIKHLSGDAQGYNVLYCGGDMFAGFWPDKGEVLLTYQEIQQMLNEGYNQPQDSVTRAKIERHSTDSRSADAMESIEEIMARTAALLKDDVVDLDAPIKGVLGVMRFKTDALTRLLEADPSADPELWHNRVVDTDFLLRTEAQSLGAESTDLHTTEVKSATFGGYEVMTETQYELFDIYSRLASYLITTPASTREFVGLCVTGNAGLGKTHLTTALARLVETQGLRVFYVDAAMVGECFQKAGGVYANYSDRIKKADLVIMDDINSEYGAAMDALRQMWEITTTQKKALVITSNHSDIGFFSLAPGAMAFNDPNSLNFYVLSGLNGESYRKDWLNGVSDSCVFIEDKMVDAIDLLCTDRESDLGRGVVVRSANPEVDVTQVVEHLASVGYTPYACLPPYRDHRVYDMYLHDLKKGSKYDSVVMPYLDDYGYPEQFVKLVMKVHDLGLRAVVLATPSVDLGHKLRYEFGHSGKRYEIRIRDRVRAVFPGIL